MIKEAKSTKSPRNSGVINYGNGSYQKCRLAQVPIISLIATSHFGSANEIDNVTARYGPSWLRNGPFIAP